MSCTCPCMGTFITHFSTFCISYAKLSYRKCLYIGFKITFLKEFKTLKNIHKLETSPPPLFPIKLTFCEYCNTLRREI